MHKSKLNKADIAYIETIGSTKSTIDRAMRDYHLVAKQSGCIAASLGSNIQDQISSFSELNSSLTQGLAAFNIPKVNLDFMDALASSGTLKDYTKNISEQINNMIKPLGFSSMESLTLGSNIQDQISSFSELLRH